MLKMEYRVSNAQLRVLIDFLTKHPALANGYQTARSKESNDKKWNELARKLNSMGSGSKKSAVRWKKYWCDIKHKSKCRLARQGQNPLGQEELSETDRRILSLVGLKPDVLVFEQPQTEENHLYIESINSLAHPETDVHCFKRSRSSSPNSNRASPLSQPDEERPRPKRNRSASSNSNTRLQTASPRRRNRSRSSNRNSPVAQPSFDPDLVIKLEKSRVEAEKKLADAAMVMAEASRIQAEASRIQAEAALKQANLTRTLVDIVHGQREDLRELLRLTREQQHLQILGDNHCEQA